MSRWEDFDPGVLSPSLDEARLTREYAVIRDRTLHGARAPKRWRLTRLTLTHEMARVVAVEQLYRAYTINRGLPYQK